MAARADATLGTKDQVASLFYELKMFDEAEPLFREVVSGRTAQYGAQHLKTLSNKMSLAGLLLDEGTAEAVAEAKVLLREVVAGRTAQHGAQHLETLRGKMNLVTAHDGLCAPALIRSTSKARSLKTLIATRQKLVLKVTC